MANPTGPIAGRQVIVPTPVPGSPRVFKRNRRIRHVWAYVQNDLTYGDHTESITMGDTALVVRGMFAEAQEAVDLWIANRQN